MVGEVRPSCTCGDTQAWCKHVCCVAALFAERLARDSFLMFTLRGLESEDLLERLRQRRAITSAAAAQGAVSVYAARIPGVSEQGAPALDQCLDRFWEIGPELRDVDFPIEPPQVAHPLLRRLGPSPFASDIAKFPLVGLLATCYEIAGKAALTDSKPAALPEPGTGVDEVTPLPEPPGPVDDSATPGACVPPRWSRAPRAGPRCPGGAS